MPTTGILWLPDLLGFSVSRSDAVYFGDYSVWSTTFALPLLIAGLLSCWLVRRDCKLAWGILLITLLAYYMALGPSVKINSTKPVAWQQAESTQNTPIMAASYAVMPTGNAWLSDKLPGFNVMRASYRWAVLGVFGLWLLVMMAVARKEQSHRAFCMLLMLVIVIFNLPNVVQKWHSGKDRRVLFEQIDDALIPEVAQHVKPGERVAFVPWGNDFIAGYLAAKAKFYTLNIGGDKNLAAAQERWPSVMLALGGNLGVSSIPGIINMLSSNEADTVVLPYFNMLWAPHLWPCMDETSASLTPNQVARYSNIPGFTCPSQHRRELADVISALSRNPYLEVNETDLFATVRLREQYRSPEGKAKIIALGLEGVSYPLIFGKSARAPLVLTDGWYPVEPQLVWSRARAKLTLPTEGHCAVASCVAVLKFNVFGASPTRPLNIEIKSSEDGKLWQQSLSLTASEGHEVRIPISTTLAVQTIEFEVLNATSPHALVGALDGRTLGLALQQIDVLPE